VSATTARHSRLKSSTMTRMRKRRATRQSETKVERPALIKRQRKRCGSSRPGRAFAATPAAHRQSLLAVQPVQLLVVHDHAFALEQDPGPPVAEAAPLAGERAQTRPHRFVAPPLSRRTVLGRPRAACKT
jgi:hypothetical protein